VLWVKLLLLLLLWALHLQKQGAAEWPWHVSLSEQGASGCCMLLQRC
jgi:hypothetical protein